MIRVRVAASRRPRESGVVLALVLVLALLLSASVITFARRAVIDTMIVRNRDAAARAEALARGGLRIASALLVEDRVTKLLIGAKTATQRDVSPGNTPDDLWHRVRNLELIDQNDGRMRMRIRDAGGLLNLNAVVPYTGKPKQVDQDAEEFLTEVFAKVIAEMEIEPGENLYDAAELAQNMIDWVDYDGGRTLGGAPEDDYYQAQDPPYRAPNRPLLSVEELGLIEGFDVQLVDAIRPYVTVHPVVRGAGINLNTAPPHVLALVYHGVGGERRPLSEDKIARILKLREQGTFVCSRGGRALENCVPPAEVQITEGSIFPAAELPSDSDIFAVTIQANVGEIERTLVAVIDRSQLSDTQVLFWRMR